MSIFPFATRYIGTELVTGGTHMNEREGQDAASFDQRANIYKRRAKSAEDMTTKAIYLQMAAHCHELANEARARTAPFVTE